MKFLYRLIIALSCAGYGATMQPASAAAQAGAAAAQKAMAVIEDATKSSVMDAAGSVYETLMTKMPLAAGAAIGIFGFKVAKKIYNSANEHLERIKNALKYVGCAAVLGLIWQTYHGKLSETLQQGVVLGKAAIAALQNNPNALQAAGVAAFGGCLLS